MLNKKFIRDPNKDGPAFKLLEVSTQIYAEVAILPYSLNAFYFPLISTFKWFSHGMSASSIQAIKTLELPLLRVLDLVERVTSSIVQFNGLEQIRLAYGVRDTRLERSLGDELRNLAEALRNAIPDVKVLTYIHRFGMSSETYY
jgi:hypothetical protein